jgi:hypothetical protein
LSDLFSLLEDVLPSTVIGVYRTHKSLDGKILKSEKLEWVFDGKRLSLKTAPEKKHLRSKFVPLSKEEVDKLTERVLGKEWKSSSEKISPGSVPGEKKPFRKPQTFRCPKAPSEDVRGSKSKAKSKVSTLRSPKPKPPPSRSSKPKPTPPVLRKGARKIRRG